SRCLQKYSMACSTVAQVSSNCRLPTEVGKAGSGFHGSLDPATQSDARPSVFIPPWGNPSSKPTYTQPKCLLSAGTNQILAFGLDQSSLLQNNTLLVSVSTKMVQARTEREKRQTARASPHFSKNLSARRIGLCFIGVLLLEA